MGAPLCNTALIGVFALMEITARAQDEGRERVRPSVGTIGTLW